MQRRISRWQCRSRKRRGRSMAKRVRSTLRREIERALDASFDPKQETTLDSNTSSHSDENPHANPAANDIHHKRTVAYHLASRWREFSPQKKVAINKKAEVFKGLLEELPGILPLGCEVLNRLHPDPANATNVSGVEIDLGAFIEIRHWGPKLPERHPQLVDAIGLSLVISVIRSAWDVDEIAKRNFVLKDLRDRLLRIYSLDQKRRLSGSYLLAYISHLSDPISFEEVDGLLWTQYADCFRKIDEALRAMKLGGFDLSPWIAKARRAAESSDAPPGPSHDLGTGPVRPQGSHGTLTPDWSRFTDNDLKWLRVIDKVNPQTGQQIADRLRIALDTPLKTWLATFCKAGLLRNVGHHKGYVRLIDLPS